MDNKMRDKVAERAREIISKIGSFPTSKNVEVIAAALVEFGEDVKNRMVRPEIYKEHLKRVKKEADAEGYKRGWDEALKAKFKTVMDAEYRRGRDYQKSLCLCDGWIEGHSEHEHQRGQEGGE